MEQASDRLVDQRVRNRVIECLEYLADGDAGIRAVGEIEYFESFFDWVDDDRPWDWRSNSAYTPEEVEAVGRVLAVLLLALDHTREMDVDATIATGWPVRIGAIAQAALELMRSRGRFDEEREEVTPTR